MESYIKHADGDTVTELISRYHQQLIDFYSAIPREKENYRYAPDKWTVKEVLAHVIDTDMIFAYRALAISRGEKQTLPGFNQDEYVSHCEADKHSLDSLKEHFKTQRELIKCLLLSFSESQLNTIGFVSDYQLSVNATCFVLFGHALHHMEILKERYL